MNKIVVWVFFIVLSTFCFADGYKILCVFAYNGGSHFVMFSRLMRVLAARGHQLDVVSHFPLKTPLPNYNDVVNLADTSPDMKNNMSYDFGINSLVESNLAIAIATQFGGEFCDLMGLPQFKKFIDSPPDDPPYDLLIVELFGAHCYLAFGKHFKVPVVTVATSPIWPWASDIFANPDNPSYIPQVFSGFTGQMNFWERIWNAFTLLRAKFLFNRHSAYQNEKIKKYLGPDAPSIEDAMENVALLLVNSHHSFQGARPFTTAVIEVGGLHVEEHTAPLPKELQKWLDDSTNGLVYVSFGSMLKIETFPKKMLADIYSSLEKLAPIRFVMKVVNADDLPPGLPNNVFTYPWIPQMAVLQHKNTRAFVTHGGLMGIYEAIYCGVPMIGVPVFGDQIQNVKLTVLKNIAVKLYLDQLNEKTLDAALDAVLHDPSYKKSAEKLSVEFRDRPLSAVDAAIFWVEYVVRHGGTNIRSPALDLSWWQIALLDVYGTLLLVAGLALYSVKVLIRKLTGMVLGGGIERMSNIDKNK